MVYEGLHSLTIIVKGDPINTWDNWFLIPSERPYVKPPGVKENFVEVPGMSGALDYTELLSGRPVYEMRKGSWDFIVASSMDDVSQKPWADLYSEIMGFLHGQSARVILSDDPTFYYEGRLKVNDWKTEKERSSITIDYTLNPYKTPIITDDEKEWEWNQLFGLPSIIYGTFDITGSKTRTIVNNSAEDIHIGTDTTAAQILAYKYPSLDSETPGAPIVIHSGVTEPDDSPLVVSPGKTKIKFEGTGKLKLFYTQGRRL